MFNRYRKDTVRFCKRTFGTTSLAVLTLLIMKRRILGILGCLVF